MSAPGLRLPGLALGPRSAVRRLPEEVLPVTLLAVAVWVAALAALPAYRVAGAPGVLAGAAGGAALISLVASRGLRLPAPLAYGASLIGLVLLLGAAVGPDPVAIVGALVRGPARVLTETLPLSGGVVEIAALVVLTWMAAAAAAEIVIRAGGGSAGRFGGASVGRFRGARARRFGRDASRRFGRDAARPGRGALSLALPVVLYVLCFAVASAAPRHDRLRAPVLLVLLAVIAVVQAAPVADPGRGSAPQLAGPDDPEPPSRRRLVLGALALTTAAAAVLAVIAPAVPGLSGKPAELHRRPPLVVPAMVDPVDAMAELRDAHPDRPAVPELTSRLDSVSTGYLAVAELSAYDGAEWQFHPTFQPTGGRVPGPPAGTQAVGDQTVTQQVSVTGAIPVPLLPALDRPVSVVGTPVATDPATGMLLPQAARSGYRYQVTSRAPAATLAGLPPADGIDPNLASPDAAAIPPNTSGDLATALRFVAQLAGSRPAADLEFLQRVLVALHQDEKRIDPSARPTSATGPAPASPGPTTTVPGAATGLAGTSLSEVINAVTVNRVATPEQFATFYAMAARYLGIPARVVTGFRLVASSAGSPLAAGSYRVTNRQAWAWVEIPVAGVGWVVADPTPDTSTAAAVPPPEAVQAPATTVPPRSANAVPRNQISGGHALAPPGRFRVSRHQPVPAWLLALLVLAGVAALAGLAGPGQAGARRAWRRRGRRSPDPTQRTVGAWLEFLDGLDRAGMPADPGATNAEIAADVAHHFGSELVEPAAAIAALADRAVFAPSDPLEADSADRAWELQDRLRRRILGQLDRRERLWSLISVGRAPRGPTDPISLPALPRRGPRLWARPFRSSPDRETTIPAQDYR